MIIQPARIDARWSPRAWKRKINVNTPKRLTRSKSEKMIAGVCGGLAMYLGLDPTLVRLIFLLVSLAGGQGVLIYLLMWVITPQEP